ncbi:dihydrodipicolinate synthase family protein [Mesorhizobium sp. BH1-1-4]|uniref:dihydrodipicolinate synthase family protein n=1 Tax=Mesorhizobium sp. BH1-1-4 TaxID=2876662 RepID=UPI001CD185A6|nr:dihydrodipicolinate synthase family protein [Mesorhizobium sp. BH1-1-4]MBZ9993986.1 dihydrodipicolinate synthase family protein [Mesorhizobium sp. BH1-1-4]
MAFLSGLCAFPITPADSDGRVDTLALRQLIARLCTAKVDSIGLLGSTGTYMYLSRQQRRRAISETLDETGGGIPVIVGVGALRTEEAIKHARDAKALGAAAGLLAAVSYAPLTDDEVFEHFSSVARRSGLPIVIYDNPGTTHFRFTPALVARLARVPGIVAVKNPTDRGDAIQGHLADQRQIVPKEFSIGYSGDWNATPAMIAGADTWYSVLGGILPEPCMGIVRAAQQGDHVQARRIDATLVPFWELFKAYSSLRVVYALAEALDICRAAPPLPIMPLTIAAKQQVADALACLRTDTGW